MDIDQLRSYRIQGVAIFDVLLTYIFARILVYRGVTSDVMTTFVLLIVVSIPLHMALGIKTTLSDKMKRLLKI